MAGNERSVRDSFRSRWGFILACIGSAVGMGNIWRFPVLVSAYGGLTFLIPYVLFVVLIGSTGVIEEFALGRWAGAGPVDAFGKCVETRGGRGYFACRNSVGPQRKQAKGGVGLANTRKRLELTYGKDFNLDIQPGADEYRVRLDFPLLPCAEKNGKTEKTQLTL